MKSLTSADFLSAKVNQNLQEVVLPKLGGSVYVKEYNVCEHERYSIKVADAKKGKANATAFATVALDEKGERIFTDDDIDKLACMPSSVIYPVIAKFRELNNDDVDEAEKN